MLRTNLGFYVFKTLKPHKSKFYVFKCLFNVSFLPALDYTSTTTSVNNNAVFLDIGFRCISRPRRATANGVDR